MQQINRIRRAIRHEFYGPRRVRALLPDTSMLKIESAIASGEARHSAELRFVIEASLDFSQVWSRATPRERAMAIFSNLQIWDTEANNGILLYVLMADQSVEIVADRAAVRAIPQSSWDEVCQRLAQAFRARDYLNGTLDAINEIHRMVEPHFPPAANDRNELPNRPVII